MNKHAKGGEVDPSKVDPEISEFIRQMNHQYEKLITHLPISPTERREIAEQARKPFRLGGPEMANTQTFFLDDNQIRIRVYTPKSRHGNSALLYVHGGGWVMFSIDTHDRLMREYADQAGCIVIGIDYSLSPEHRFPKALDEIDQVYKWVETDGAEFGLDINNVIIGGDSAGGNLSLCSTLRRRDENLALPRGILLNYAALDTEIRPSYQEFDGAPYVLDVDEMAAFWLDYLGTPNTDNPYARPLLADLTGLPPVHLCIANCDILRDENLVLHDRLINSDVDVSCEIYEGATHSFLEAMSMSACARKAISDSSKWLKQKGS